MNKFTFFAAIAIATTMMVGCDDNEEHRELHEAA